MVKPWGARRAIPMAPQFLNFLIPKDSWPPGLALSVPTALQSRLCDEASRERTKRKREGSKKENLAPLAPRI